MQVSVFAVVIASASAFMPAFAEEPTTKPASTDSGMAGPKPEGSAPKGKDFGGGNKKQGEMGPLQKILKNLDLTSDQETKIKDLVKAHEDKVVQFQAENRVKMDDLRSAVEKAKATGDKSQVDTLTEQKKALEKNRPKLETLFSQISDVLTPEQREKFKTQVQEHKNSLEGKKDGPKDKEMSKEMRQEKKDERKEKKELKQGGKKGKDQLNM